jgi:malonyl-CoA O-methyltransferase
MRLTAQKAYDVLAESYDQLPNPMIALERGAMSALIPDLSGLTVADLGCGTGRYTLRALERGARRVYAVDLSGGMLRVARSRLVRDERVALLQADMQALPFAEGRLDGILSGLALGYAPRLDRAVGELGRVLRPGGFALLSDLHPIGPSLGWEREYRVAGNGSSPRLLVEHHPYTFERLFDLCFDAGFSLEEIQEVPVGDAARRFARGWRERLRVRRIRGVPAVAIFLLRKES